MQPTISVGILSASRINFILNEAYKVDGQSFVGAQYVQFESGRVKFNGNTYSELILTPVNNATASFDLIDVLIGIGFHWERKEIQRFNAQLKIIVEGDTLTAINVLSVEDYLLSVISSEMSATSSLELLKAHAVISRSWLLAQLNAKKGTLTKKINNPMPKNCEFDNAKTNQQISNELIKWYDKDDHANFDVCADDHCQRYQGITKASTQLVKNAVESTKGQVIFYEGNICDARFSKCCGGISELFENCWEPVHHAYLLPIEDKAVGGLKTAGMNELQVEAFVKHPLPGDFCNTTDAKVLKQVLNDYDQETADFYRWKVSYSQHELAALVKKKSGIDFGSIIDLIPIERGVSGRLIKLKIVGSKMTKIIGKELEIRKYLSDSHLYSSAFVVEKFAVKEGIPQEFILYGAGWGHGVGLCQIGAAVMAEKGYAYQDILKHYFKTVDLNIMY